MVDRLFGTIESSKGSEMPWDIKCFRGENAEQLVDYVILAEFDIDTGYSDSFKCNAHKVQEVQYGINIQVKFQDIKQIGLLNTCCLKVHIIV